MLNAVAMARESGTERDPVVALDLVGRIMMVRTRDGRMHVPAPVDYVAWTEPVKGFAQRKNLKAVKRTVLVTGISSARAREGLRAAGWTVQEHSKR
jgi:hypothetical protein